MNNSIWWSRLFQPPLVELHSKAAKRLHKGLRYLENLWNGPLLDWRDLHQIRTMFQVSLDAAMIVSSVLCFIQKLPINTYLNRGSWVHDWKWGGGVICLSSMLILRTYMSQCGIPPLGN